MLDQLVESKDNHLENNRRSKFVALIAIVAALSLITAWTVSLFGKDFGMGGDDLALTTLVAPVPVPDEEPPPKPEPKPEQKQPDVDVRKELIQNIMSTPVKPPDVLATTKNAVKEMRLDRMTKVGATDADTGAKIDPNQARVTDTGGTGGLGDGGGTAPTGGSDDAPPPPPVKKAPPKTVSGGVLNGKAILLPKPAYPAAARFKGDGGAVSVQVMIDEKGNVIRARPMSGAPTLQIASRDAACAAKFSPLLLAGNPIKVSGVITYNFIP